MLGVPDLVVLSTGGASGGTLPTLGENRTVIWAELSVIPAAPHELALVPSAEEAALMFNPPFLHRDSARSPRAEQLLTSVSHPNLCLAEAQSILRAQPWVAGDGGQ